MAIAFKEIRAQETRLLEELVELTEIPAPPFAENARAKRFSEMMRDTGVEDVSIDAVGNVIGVRRGSNATSDTGVRRTIVLSAHLDTVFPTETDVTVRVEGDAFYAPGIGDNTRGLVTLLGVLRAIQKAEIDTRADIWFIGNVGEEGLGDLRGMKHLFREGAEPIDALIAIDGGNTARIVYGGVGSHRYRITFRGEGGHSRGAFGRPNPHQALGRAITSFYAEARDINETGAKTSYSIGRIGGGTSVNSIPFESWMEVDMRSGDQRKLDQIDAMLHTSVDETLTYVNAARTEGQKLTVELERVGTRPAGLGDKSGALVQHAWASMRVLGIEPDFRISSTDANLPISKGIPAITLSRGGVSKNAHAPNESWQNKDSHLALQIVLLTLLAQAQLAE